MTHYHHYVKLYYDLLHHNSVDLKQFIPCFSSLSIVKKYVYKDKVKVQGGKSPYDGDIKYWSQRMGTHPEISTREAKLLKKQKGKCTHCGHNFLPDDKWEIDHIIPKALGGRDTYENTQLLHKHCHDSKTREDLSEIRRIRREQSEIKIIRQTKKTLAGANVNCPIAEEPCEGKSLKHGSVRVAWRSQDKWVW